MLLSLVLLGVGLGLLTKAADWFVDGAAALALQFKMSAVVVGAVVIGFGTSLPEMLVSGIAAGQGDRELGIGNVIGSNVANLSLVLGVGALIVAIGVSPATMRRELPLSVAATMLFAALIQNGISRLDGVILAAAMVGVLVLLLRRADDTIDYSEELADIEQGPLQKELVLTIVGLAGTVGGAWLLVTGATRIADEIGLSDGFVGLTLVAIGTSLPELVTAVTACRKGHTDLIVGNLLGSNMFNSLAVGAVIGLVGPGAILDGNLTGLATILMLAIALLAGAFMISGSTVVKWEAVALLVVYLATIPFTAGGLNCDADDLSPADVATCAEVNA